MPGALRLHAGDSLAVWQHMVLCTYRAPRIWCALTLSAGGDVYSCWSLWPLGLGRAYGGVTMHWVSLILRGYAHVWWVARDSFQAVFLAHVLGLRAVASPDECEGVRLLSLLIIFGIASCRGEKSPMSPAIPQHSHSGRSAALGLLQDGRPECQTIESGG